MIIHTKVRMFKRNGQGVELSPDTLSHGTLETHDTKAYTRSEILSRNDNDDHTKMITQQGICGYKGHWKMKH